MPDLSGATTLTNYANRFKQQFQSAHINRLKKSFKQHPPLDKPMPQSTFPIKNMDAITVFL